MTTDTTEFEKEYAVAPSVLNAMLEDCPFCGGEAAYVWIEYSERHVKEQGWKQRMFDFVSCVSCGVSNKGLVGFKTKKQAASHWNTRAANVELRGRAL